MQIFGEVTEITEKNYFFKLSKYQDWLVTYLKENPSFIEPAHRQNQVLEFLKEPLNDLCISLLGTVELGHSSHSIRNTRTHAWFDAFVN